MKKSYKNPHGINKNDLIELDITDMNNLGNGVGRYRLSSAESPDTQDSIVVFVSGAIVGDRVRAKIILVKPDFLVGRLEELLTPSPYRTEGGCPLAAKCGGCVYQNLDYNRELELKRSYVKAAFAKAGLPDTEVAPTVSASKNGSFAYRNKVQYPISADPSAPERLTVGYFAPKTHRIIPIPDDGCMLQTPELQPVTAFILKRLNETGGAKRFPPYREEEHTGLLRHLYLRRAAGTGEIMVVFIANSDLRSLKKLFSPLADEIAERFPEVKTVLVNSNTERTNVILGESYAALVGDGRITDSFEGLRFRISAPAFYQVNTEGMKLLYRLALELAELEPEDTVADLFCGVGTIGLYMLRHSGARKLIGIEVVPEAVENARENAVLNEASDAEFVCGDANSPELDEASVVVIDPPRKGCEPELVETLCRLAPERIVYVSCSADTLARDAALFAQHGYKVGKAHPVDMFPRTGHVETVCLLSKL